ncbi:MAG: Asp-tRNA(Asn)/Glu-tRNA(Gln) amidotransferase subunit GatB [Bacteroidota bacterium]
MSKSTRDKYVAVIGLEIHAQLALQRKMFAPEAAVYGALPNTQVSTVSLAHPGTLPRINKCAIDYAVKMGLACHSTITHENIFARKNYFYPDLPKGYQITQDKTPICQGGYLIIDTPQGKERDIALERIHLEEDTGKSIHGLVVGETLLDFNRAGTALIEIVTKPDLQTSTEAYRLLTEIRKLVRYLDICDGNMEEGSLRCDANVSVMLRDAAAFGQRVEVKNMNSIRHVQLAIEHEIDRHIAVLEDGGTVVPETRAYHAPTNTTKSLRAKETTNDYRYFPEPDLPPLIVSGDWIEKLRQQMPLLPRACFQKFVNTYQLSPYSAAVLTEDRDTALYFEALCQLTPHYKTAANWMIGPVKAYLNGLTHTMSDFPLLPKTMAELTTLVAEGQLSFSTASQKLYPKLLTQPSAQPAALAQSMHLLQECDTDKIRSLVDEVIAAHPSKVTAYRNGKKGLLGMFMGEIMKKSQGNVAPQLASSLLTQRLEKER